MESPAASSLDWQSTLQLVDVGVVVQDHTHRILFANARATEMLGLSTEQIVARHTNDTRWDVVDAHGVPLTQEDHPGPTAARTGLPVRGRLLGVRRGDAETRTWLLVSAIPQLDAEGTVRRVHITFSDVSETQRAFLEQEAEYQSVFSAMSEGVVIHEVDGRIRSANAAAEQVLGLSLDEMTGRTPMSPDWYLTDDVGQPIDPTQVPSEIAARTGETAQRILGVRRANGERAWLKVRADPLRHTGAQELVGVVATFTDITVEREATLALAASKQQIQRVLDAVPGVVFQYFADQSPLGRVTFVAGRSRELLGLDSEELLGSVQPLPAIFDDEAASRLYGAIRHAVDTRGAFDHEARITHPENGEQWIRIRGVPTETPHGLLFTGVMLDVTAQHRMADALRKTQRREAMADMAGGIAHNFNNMLAVILPNIQLAQDEADGIAAQHLADAERAAVSAADLVRRMLALGRADYGQQVASIDLVPIIHEALHICRQTFDRGITLEEDVAVTAASVHGTASTLQQLLLNLLLNGRDAVFGVRAPTLSVTLRQADDAHVELIVRDNGAGMTEDVQRRIGEPFFTTKAPGRGTGLGLASAFHAIAEASGTWHVESSAGQGTAFHVRLPLRETAAAVPVVGELPHATLEGTVLIVDDEPMVRTALARQLTQCGMRAVLAPGGAEALKQVEAGVNNLRVILLDLSMPGMSGMETLPLLRAAVPHVPVVAMSGHVPPDAVLDGAAAVLEKPMGRRELQDTLERVLRTR